MLFRTRAFLVTMLLLLPLLALVACAPSATASTTAPVQPPPATVASTPVATILPAATARRQTCRQAALSDLYT